MLSVLSLLWYEQTTLMIVTRQMLKASRGEPESYANVIIIQYDVKIIIAKYLHNHLIQSNHVTI